MSNSVNLFEFVEVAILLCNVQHSSTRVNLRIGILLDRILVSSVPHATVHTLKTKRPLKPKKPKKPKNLFLNLGFY